MGAFHSKASAQLPPKQPQVTAIDRTMLDLKNARDRLSRYRTKLAQDDVRLREQAIKAKQNGQTTTALGLLRLRKFKQQQAAACEDQLLNVLKMVETIDSRQNDAHILAAMASGKDALAALQKETTVEKVLDLMEQIQDQHDYQQEINEALQAVPALSGDEEQAVLDELQALQDSLTATNEPSPLQLPNVPTHALPNVVEPVSTTTKVPERVAVPG
jgi:charged multivesicular body protein 6